jgi:hypothetical protein
LGDFGVFGDCGDFGVDVDSDFGDFGGFSDADRFRVAGSEIFIGPLPVIQG